MKEDYLDLISFDIFQHPGLLWQLSNVTVNLGRRKGHSTYIQKNVQPFDIVIFKFYKELEDFRRSVPNHSYLKLLTPFRELDELRGHVFEKVGTIWVDGYHYNFTEDDRQLIDTKLPMIIRCCEKFSSSIKKRVIRLG